jgi:hypothetical protein
LAWDTKVSWLMKRFLRSQTCAVVRPGVNLCACGSVPAAGRAESSCQCDWHQCEESGDDQCQAAREG